MSKKFIGILWPSAYQINTDYAIDSIISNHVEIVEKKIIPLSSFQSLKNFIYQVYYAELWVGNFENHFCGVNGKTGYCFDEQLYLTVYDMRADDIDSVNELKTKIRSFCKMEKHSFHTTDNDIEYKYVYNICMNNNSILIINNTCLYLDRSFYLQFSEYSKKVLNNAINVENMIILNNILSWNSQILRYGKTEDYPNLAAEENYGWYLGVKIVSPNAINKIGDYI